MWPKKGHLNKSIGEKRDKKHNKNQKNIKSRQCLLGDVYNLHQILKEHIEKSGYTKYGGFSLEQWPPNIKRSQNHYFLIFNFVITNGNLNTLFTGPRAWKNDCVIFLQIHHTNVHFWSSKTNFENSKLWLKEQWRPCFVKPKSKLKTKKMRLDVLMGLVSRILSYDQKM